MMNVEQWIRIWSLANEKASLVCVKNSLFILSSPFHFFYIFFPLHSHDFFFPLASPSSSPHQTLLHSHYLSSLSTPFLSPPPFIPHLYSFHILFTLPTFSPFLPSLLYGSRGHNVTGGQVKVIDSWPLVTSDIVCHHATLHDPQETTFRRHSRHTYTCTHLWLAQR